MHFFKHSKPVDLVLHESLKKEICDLIELPKKWPYLGESSEEAIPLENIELGAWSLYPPFMQVRFRLIVESLQQIVARLDLGNLDKLDNADLINLIDIAKYTFISAPERAFDQVANSLEPDQIRFYKKAAEEIELKFCSLSAKNPTGFIRTYLFDNNPYQVLVNNVKKNIFKQLNPREEDPDMYLTARISSAIYRML